MAKKGLADGMPIDLSNHPPVFQCCILGSRGGVLFQRSDKDQNPIVLYKKFILTSVVHICQLLQRTNTLSTLLMITLATHGLLVQRRRMLLMILSLHGQIGSKFIQAIKLCISILTVANSSVNASISGVQTVVLQLLILLLILLRRMESYTLPLKGRWHTTVYASVHQCTPVSANYSDNH